MTKLGEKYRANKEQIIAAEAEGLKQSNSPKCAIAACYRSRIEQCYPKSTEIDRNHSNGTGLYFPAINANVFIPVVMEGFTSTRRWRASQLGRLRRCQAVAHS